MKQVRGKPALLRLRICAVELKHLRRVHHAADRDLRAATEPAEHGTPTPPSAVCTSAPVLNLKLDADVKKMRAIAEAAFDLVAGYKEVAIRANMATASVRSPSSMTKMFRL